MTGLERLKNTDNHQGGNHGQHQTRTARPSPRIHRRGNAPVSGEERYTPVKLESFRDLVSGNLGSFSGAAISSGVITSVKASAEEVFAALRKKHPTMPRADGNPHHANRDRSRCAQHSRRCRGNPLHKIFGVEHFSVLVELRSHLILWRVLFHCLSKGAKMRGSCSKWLLGIQRSLHRFKRKFFNPASKI